MLCREAQLYMSGKDWRTEDFIRKVSFYKEKHRDFDLVCDCNHRLGFFVEELYRLFKDKARFLFLIRDPIETLVSRVANWSHWREIIHRYPDFYQVQVKERVPDAKLDYNNYRITPPSWDMPLHDLYLWEWLETFNETSRQLSAVKEEHRRAIHTEDLNLLYPLIYDLVGKNFFVLPRHTEHIAKIKHDSIHNREGNNDTIEYAKSLIFTHKRYILSKIQSGLKGGPFDMLVNSYLDEHLASIDVLR